MSGRSGAQPYSAPVSLAAHGAPSKRLGRTSPIVLTADRAPNAAR